MITSSAVRKVVIPAAGLGTRFLPATKVVPKEMMPLAGKPLIQLAVEEAAASGIETVILVVGKGKSSLLDHFHRDIALENTLQRRGRGEDAETLRSLCQLADVRAVWQDAPLGLADAIGTARSLVGDEPFAVILPDAVIDSAVPCIRQLMSCYEKYPGCILATQIVSAVEVDRFGIIDAVPVRDAGYSGRVLAVNSLTERPQPDTVSSRYGIFGRYILEPAIFQCIEHTPPGYGGELQLTDSLLLCSRHVPLYAYRFEGQHYDAGSKLGFLQATLAYALKDPELSHPLREHLASLEVALATVQ
jgi:UTP--glucose-1-phosphate uridylyltransferase